MVQRHHLSAREQHALSKTGDSHLTSCRIGHDRNCVNTSNGAREGFDGSMMHRFPRKASFVPKIQRCYKSGLKAQPLLPLADACCTHSMTYLSRLLAHLRPILPQPCQGFERLAVSLTVLLLVVRHGQSDEPLPLLLAVLCSSPRAVLFSTQNSVNQGA